MAPTVSLKTYADLKEHILKHKLTISGKGTNSVDGDLIDLHEIIQFGEILTTRGNRSILIVKIYIPVDGEVSL